MHLETQQILMNENILEIKDLSVNFKTDLGIISAVNKFNLFLKKNQE